MTGQIRRLIEAAAEAPPDEQGDGHDAVGILQHRRMCVLEHGRERP
jgi:hypothetical protein